MFRRFCRLFYGLLNGSHFILCAAHAYRAAAAEEPCEQGVDLEQFLLGEHDHPPAPPGDHDEHRVDGGDMGGRKDAALWSAPFSGFRGPLHGCGSRYATKATQRALRCNIISFYVVLFTFSAMIFFMAARLCSKSAPKWPAARQRPPASGVQRHGGCPDSPAASHRPAPLHREYRCPLA